ncbi:hypothetical protein HGRIS_010906 [Hohenbuehelia grisea]|uniref:Transcription elongation factor n=1 Tax=Hohenbuehelia grisea TaxID=104357 RepID=A0ABR3IY71_9AGAR
MSDAAELKKVVKKLQSASTEEEIIDLLGTLKKGFQVNEAILRESRAGLAVGKLRTHARKEVSDAAKELVKKWKTEVDKAKGAHGGASKPPARKASIASAPATPVTPTGSGSKSDTRTAKSDGVKINFTGEITRDKCTELLYDALACDSGAPSDLIVTRARAIEKTVYNDNDGANAAYKSKIRSLFVNLKDKNNPSLREGVVSGDLAPEQFARMSSQDMASEERKAANAKIQAENLFASLGAEEQQAETDAFQCGRCKQRKCRYRQAQTRSADEPMTVSFLLIV